MSSMTPMSRSCPLRPLLLCTFALVFARSETATAASTVESTMTFNLGICCTEANGTSCAAPIVVCTSDSACSGSFPICAGTKGSDATASGSGSSYPPAFGSCNPTSAYLIPERSLNNSTYTVTSALIAWDTSALPDDAVITGATLRIYSSASKNANADARQITGEWYNWDQPVAGCDSSDYTTTTANNALSGVSISALVFTYNNLALSNVGNINRAGSTYLRLHVSGGQPAAINRAYFASRDSTQFAGPALIVSYQQPSRCIGDCRNSGAVTISDLVTMINITLGSSLGSACQAGDANGDGAIRIDEMLTAVNNALGTCPAP